MPSYHYYRPAYLDVRGFELVTSLCNVHFSIEAPSMPCLCCRAHTSGMKAHTRTSARKTPRGRASTTVHSTPTCAYSTRQPPTSSATRQPSQEKHPATPSLQCTHISGWLHRQGHVEASGLARSRMSRADPTVANLITYQNNLQSTCQQGHVSLTFFNSFRIKFAT